MEKKETIQPVKGSIFDADRAEGIAVFIPFGLVSIRMDAEEFVRKFGVEDLKPKDMVVRSLPEPPCGIIRHLVFFDNLEKTVHNLEDMRKQVIDTLDAFAKLGAKTVAMNGIRCSEDLPDESVRPEQYQRKYVEEYLESHPGVFETVYLVDERGGFNH